MTRRRNRMYPCGVRATARAFGQWVVLAAMALTGPAYAGQPQHPQVKDVSRLEGAAHARAESSGKGSPDEVRERESEWFIERQRRFPKFSLRNADDVSRLMSTFPDLSRATSLDFEDVRVPTIPDDLLKKIAIHGKNLRSLSIGVLGRPADDQTGCQISDAGMSYVSQLPKLETLNIAGRFSAEGLAHLSKLPKLKTFGLEYPPFLPAYVPARRADLHPRMASSGELFAAVSKMPNIQSLGVRYADFSQPIDDATYKAIASLNGRVKSLSFGEWGETTIHVSMIPAIAEINSLTWLELGNFKASYEDLNPIRKNLLKLEHFGPLGEETEGIPAKP